ncbi:MAG: hypothetical protein HRU36_05195 [Rickettsiales bacterium]|nr:hypothetical protein [Rickettsiales bacterium]
MHIILFICLLFLITPSGNSFGIATKQKKELVLCQPTKKIAVLDKPITYDPAYTDNNTTKDAGEFKNKHLDIILIRGIIKDKKCIPIPNASIEIWQEDEYGKKRYDKFSYSFTDRYELNKEQFSSFLGIATATSNNNGYFNFITVIPRSKLKRYKKQSLINVSISHKNFPKLENQILLNPKWLTKKTNKKIFAFRNIGAEKFYHLPTYDFEIVLNGYNKYKTF